MKITQLFGMFQTFLYLGIDVSYLLDGRLNKKHITETEGTDNNLDISPHPSTQEEVLGMLNNVENHNKTLHKRGTNEMEAQEDGERHNSVAGVNGKREGTYQNPVQVSNSPACVKSFHDTLTGLKKVDLNGKVRVIQQMKPLVVPRFKTGNLVVDLDKDEYNKEIEVQHGRKIILEKRTLYTNDHENKIEHVRGLGLSRLQSGFNGRMPSLRHF